MVEVALSGNLDFVPLDEVLRLLTRSKQHGAVIVQGEQVRGRIFISKGGIGLATTADDETLRRHLVNSGYVDGAYLDGVEAGEASLAPLAEDQDGGIAALLREMTTESLYQLSHNGVSFEVTEEDSSPYLSPEPFDLEAILEDARQRSEEWAEVSSVVADLNSLIRMNRDIGDRESVEISRAAWRLLCEMGSGASVSTLAGRLGTTEFWTAQVTADLTDRGLLIVGGEAEADETTDAAEPEWVQPVDADETVEADEAIERIEVTSPDESWWQEPEIGQTDDESDQEADGEVESVDAHADADADAETGVVGVKAEKPAEEKNRFFGQFAPNKKEETLEYQHIADAEPSSDEDTDKAEFNDETAEQPVAADAEQLEDDLPPLEAAETADVEEDTEAFLEKVFSELESNGQPEDEGHGLLRRRRQLGSVLKELDED